MPPCPYGTTRLATMSLTWKNAELFMNGTVVQIDRISKVYRLYHHHLDRLKESLHPLRKRYHQDFFALNDVSFSVIKGETIGIIGKNASGKSTLLKIIAGILTPSSGRATVKGRVSALLELGAGFNPELTGIENIYFSGTIMGYTREEMNERLGTIKKFAGIDDYIDQPVKTYSSGMYVRLAFATAINVDPDILIVDEALAVGDISFQAKCFRKFNEFKDSGKTIIFVTHALDTVIRYCDRTMVLDKGHKITETTPKDAVDVYKQLITDSYDDKNDVPRKTGVMGHDDKALSDSGRRVSSASGLSYGSKQAEIVDYAILDEAKQPVQLLFNGQRFVIRMKVEFHDEVHNPIFAYTVKDLKGLEITGTNTLFKKVETGHYRPGHCALIEFNQVLNAQSGHYSLSLGCTGFNAETMVVYHRLYDVLLFEVVSPAQLVGFYDLNSTITVETQEQKKKE